MLTLSSAVHFSKKKKSNNELQFKISAEQSKDKRKWF